jgi:hypothetical protein
VWSTIAVGWPTRNINACTYGRWTSVDRNHLEAFEVLLEGAARDAQTPGDFPLGETWLEGRAPLLVLDITAPGILRVGSIRGHPFSGSPGATPAHRVRSRWTRSR